MEILSWMFIGCMAAIILLTGTDSATSLACFGAGIVGTTALVLARRAYNRRPPRAEFGPPVHLIPSWNWRRWLFCVTVLTAVGIFAWRCWAGVKYAGNHYPYLFQGAYLAAPLIFAAWWAYQLGWHLSTANRMHDLAHYANYNFKALIVHSAFMGGHYEELACAALRAINCLEAASVIPGAHGVNNLGRAEAAIQAANFILVQIAAIEEVSAQLTAENDSLKTLLAFAKVIGGDTSDLRSCINMNDDALDHLAVISDSDSFDRASWLAERERLQAWRAQALERHDSFVGDVATTSV